MGDHSERTHRTQEENLTYPWLPLSQVMEDHSERTHRTQEENLGSFCGWASIILGTLSSSLVPESIDILNEIA